MSATADDDPETRFTPGDRVRIVNRKSYGYGREGVITDVRPDAVYFGIVVDFGQGDTCLYGPTALAVIATDGEQS